MASAFNGTGGFGRQLDQDLKMIEQITQDNSEIYAPHLNKPKPKQSFSQSLSSTVRRASPVPSQYGSLLPRQPRPPMQLDSMPQLSGVSTFIPNIQAVDNPPPVRVQRSEHKEIKELREVPSR